MARASQIAPKTPAYQRTWSRLGESATARPMRPTTRWKRLYQPLTSHSPRNELWCVESKWASAKKPVMPTKVSSPPNTIAYQRAQFWVSLGVGW